MHLRDTYDAQKSIWHFLTICPSAISSVLFIRCLYTITQCFPDDELCDRVRHTQPTFPTSPCYILLGEKKKKKIVIVIYCWSVYTPSISSVNFFQYLEWFLHPSCRFNLENIPPLEVCLPTRARRVPKNLRVSGQVQVNVV